MSKRFWHRLPRRNVVESAPSLVESEQEDDERAVAAPSFAYKVLATKSGYVKSFKLQNVVAEAEELDLCVRYCYQIGELHKYCYTNTQSARLSLEKRLVEVVDDKNEDKNQPWEQQVEQKLGILAAKGISISKIRKSELDSDPWYTAAVGHCRSGLVSSHQ